MKKEAAEALKQPFGTVFAEKIAVAHFKDGEWTPFTIEPLKPFSMHPASHVFHYSSTCFEGLKVHRRIDGSDAVFRLDRHIRRMQTSSELLGLPIPEANLLENMIIDLVGQCRDWIPDHPGSLYVRPTLIGTLPSIGAAAAPTTEAMLYILLSPVGNYFAGGMKPLKLLVDDTHMRTSPDSGMAKTGGNYASALRFIMDAKAQYGANQVLFAPGGDVQETGAANFFMMRNRTIRTKALEASFLHGVTRDSMLKIAADIGYEVIENEISIPELLEWAQDGEAALSGTAAVLAGVGSYVHHGETFTVGNGEIGPMTMELRNALIDIQSGRAEDKFGWMREI